MQSDQPAKPTLGRLEKLDLTAYWQKEQDFTPWLAQPGNLKLLGDAIGLELEVVAEAQRVGPFQADVLCRDTATDNWVLIETQLAPTDPLHLGQLITVAAGLDAVNVVWIASHFATEHRTALNWLNQITQEDCNFFGLEIELWQIGESAMAANFNLVSQPNGWTRAVTKVTEQELTETQLRHLEFWTGLCQQLERRGSIVKPGEPTTKRMMEFAIGRAGFRLYACLDEDDQCLYAGLLLLSEDAQPHFYLLEEEQEQLETEMESPLTWEEANAKTCSIAAVLTEAPIADREDWPTCYKWLCERLERFHDVFADRVKHLNANHYQKPPDYSFDPLQDSLILPNG